MLIPGWILVVGEEIILHMKVEKPTLPGIDLHLVNSAILQITKPSINLTKLTKIGKQMSKKEFLVLIVLIDIYSYISFSIFSFLNIRDQDIVNRNIFPFILITYFVIFILFSINRISKVFSYSIVRVGFVFLLLFSRLALYIIFIGVLIF